MPKIDIDALPPAGIVPEGLVKRLDTIATWEPADSPRAAAIKEAADVLRNMPIKLNDKKRLVSPAFQADGYRIETDVGRKEVRFICYENTDRTNLLAYLVFDSAEAYEFAGTILKAYDKVEDVK